MAFWGDYHTHSTYSHGKGSVLDNALAAKRVGLKEIAITDHGIRHIVFGIKDKKLPALKADCEAARKQTGVNVLAGIENNFCSHKGLFDCDKSVLDKLDIVQGGYHKAVWSYNFAEQFSFQFNNMFHYSFKIPSKKLMIKNTDAYLRLIDNYELDFIGHINRDIHADALEVARYAKQKGTFIELNSKRLTITDAEMEKMAEEGVLFICNSDAHTPERVGDMSAALALIQRLGVPYELIVNWEKFPSFRSSNYKRYKERLAGESSRDPSDGESIQE